MKGVILAAGYGTRFLPASKTIPKEMFPLLDKPAISFIVDEFIQAGIDKFIVVSSRRKKVLNDYFDRDIELEQFLSGEKRKKILPPQIEVTFLYQRQMLGAGDALMMLEPWINDEPFVVAYPDDIHVGVSPLSSQLMAMYQRTNRSVLALQETEGDISRYGVAAVRSCEGMELVTELVEKPEPGSEPSRLVSYGRYLFTPDIFTALHQAREYYSGAGEFIQDQALQHLITEGKIAAVRFEGRILDVGTPLGYLQASVEYALSRQEYREQLLAFLKEVSASHQ